MSGPKRGICSFCREPIVSKGSKGWVHEGTGQARGWTWHLSWLGQHNSRSHRARPFKTLSGKRVQPKGPTS